MAKDAEHFKPLTVIDDDEISHFIFRALMNQIKPEISVEAFIRAQDVLAQIQTGSFCSKAIVLDINMPNMTGWEFLIELEKINYPIPVYMLTSSSDVKDRNNMAKFKNVVGYFLKPLTPGDLMKILDTHFK
jgi:CheY-like chemotaxis protein